MLGNFSFSEQSISGDTLFTFESWTPIIATGTESWNAVTSSSTESWLTISPSGEEIWQSTFRK
tara:strand:- start:406 stop:594 length:189 start_codon:yes stop_codon:yes gene_type:complete